MAEDLPADVGRWFATGVTGGDATGSEGESAAGRVVAGRVVTGRGPASGRGLPRIPAWGPDPRGGYGRRSSDAEIAAARGLLLAHGPVAVLTGAGMSTGSGLPDYRGAQAVPRSPMTYQEFVASDLSRRRYWARSTVGWTAFSRARPGPAHTLLAGLGEPLRIAAVITQNVDGLHERAGSHPVIDLHGRLDRVRCLDCGEISGRDRLHARLLTMNPRFAARLPELAREAAQAPDGDAEVDRTASFRYPPCSLCGGMLKPDVVFFGESARPELVAQARAAVDGAGSLLVLGSSLTVMSGLRFVRRAAQAGRPVVILNDGPTRGDGLATMRLHGRLEEVLARWSDARAEIRRTPAR